MKRKKKTKCRKIFCQIIGACIFFAYALLFYGGKEETAGAAEVEESKAMGETEEIMFKISETAGMPGKDGAVLAEVRQQYRVSFTESMPVQFVFDDGTAVEWLPEYANYMLEGAQCLDMTGDGRKEVLLWGYFVNTATEYNMLNIFQVDGREVTELSFQEDIAELKDEVCNTSLFYRNRGDQKGYALQVETYGKEGACVFLEQRMEIYYENGKWIKLPRRKLNIRVSLESDSEAARIYEAFLRGECNAGEWRKRRYAMDYCHLGLKDYEDFCFQDILDGILEGSRKTHWTPAVPVEDVEYGLMDCVESVEYGLMDCGKDGRPELALRVRGVHEYSNNKDFDVILIFGCRNGKVKLLYGVDIWESRHAEICSEGSIYIDGKGVIYCDQNDEWSFEAKAEGDEAEYRCLESAGIGSDYLYRTACRILVGTGREVGGMTAYKPLCGEELSAEFYQCMLGDKKIYAYRIFENLPEDVLEHTKDYIAENEDKLGVKFFSYETMQALCDAQERKRGISGYDARENKIQWQVLQGCEEYIKSALGL